MSENKASLPWFQECGWFPVPLVPQPMGTGKYETNGSSHPHLPFIGGGLNILKEAIKTSYNFSIILWRTKITANLTFQLGSYYTNNWNTRETKAIWTRNKIKFRRWQGMVEEMLVNTLLLYPKVNMPNNGSDV